MNTILISILIVIAITQSILAIGLAKYNSNNERLLNIVEKDREAFKKMSNLVEKSFNDLYKTIYGMDLKK